MIYFCCDTQRRAEVKKKADLNGIDFLEVLDSPSLPDDQRQRTLFVHFLKGAGVASLRPEDLLIEGGERIRDIKVLTVAVEAGAPEVLVVTVDQAGDFSTYILRLRRTTTDTLPSTTFDPLMSAIDFSFKVECQSDFDCAPVRRCTPESLPGPEIDYLVKDFTGFRRLMLDRMSALMPEWRERNAADPGVALVEMLAYVADHLSYRQDAIATEAYLATARRRVSVRRHARLIDYRMHDGCNARTWLHVHLDEHEAPETGILLPRVDSTASRTHFLTRCLEKSHLSVEDLDRVRTNGVVEVFEPTVDATLYRQHNEMAFYTWGEKRCCLPRGATKATLKDTEARLRLRPGDVLLFEERKGPNTGRPADADPARRQAVVLTEVHPEATPVMADAQEVDRIPGALVKDQLTKQPIVEIRWAPEDALRFPLCLSSVTDAAHGAQALDDVSVVLGNIVLVDHGLSIEGEDLGVVPAPAVYPARRTGGAPCGSTTPVTAPPRFSPTLEKRPLTHVAPVPPTSVSAVSRMNPPVASALPSLRLKGEVSGKPSLEWVPVHDLLNGRADSLEFVVEVENDGLARIRFGDDRHGRRPDPGTRFKATYRVGNGTAGNIGADALVHIVASASVARAVAWVRNPLPAEGGVDPESLEDVRQRAPSAFQTQERAVTPADYVDVVERHAGVQRAAATLRWTGSWRTVFITPDRVGGAPVDAPFEKALRDRIEPYRMAGQDVEIDAPRPVPLEITLRVCVRPDHFRGDVKAALLQVFSKDPLPDGRKGMFHPDHFTFGQPVYLSRIYAAAQAVDGVAWVEVTQFERQGRPDTKAFDEGVLRFDRLEIPRLDNDPNDPDRGIFRVIVQGGK